MPPERSRRDTVYDACIATGATPEQAAQIAAEFAEPLKVEFTVTNRTDGEVACVAVDMPTVVEMTTPEEVAASNERFVRENELMCGERSPEFEAMAAKHGAEFRVAYAAEMKRRHVGRIATSVRTITRASTRTMRTARAPRRQSRRPVRRTSRAKALAPCSSEGSDQPAPPAAWRIALLAVAWLAVYTAEVALIVWMVAS